MNYNLFLAGVKHVFSPKVVYSELKKFNKKEYLLMFVMLAAPLVAFVYGNSFTFVDWMGFLTSIATSLSLILVDKGYITNFMWGTIGSITWLVASIDNRLISDISSQIFYVVMQFVGIYVWYKLKDVNQDAVKSKKMSYKALAAVVIISVALYFLNVFISTKLNGNQILLDASLLPLGIVGQFLMTYDFREQWIFWVAIDVINVIIWSLQLSAGGSAALSMLVLQVIMLINAFYGTYRWYTDKNGVQSKEHTKKGNYAHVHFAYANSSDGKIDFSNKYFKNAQYIGISIDKTKIASTKYTDYQWDKLLGKEYNGKVDSSETTK